MVKLLIIADDFTGALDTGVKFAARGAKTRVVMDPAFDFNQADDQIQVLVMDAETRHLEPTAAYSIVYQAVTRALAAGVHCIYKKTDSALRGNIGAELTAMLNASNEDRLPFIPAFPKAGRITRNGIHLVDGVPVAESVFGRDPFEPVRHSQVADILKEQSSVPCVYRIPGKPDKDLPGIQVFDAASDEDLLKIGHQLGNGLRLCAGCAGFAAVLAELLSLTGCVPQVPPLHGPLFIACGSVNPVTRQQLDTAERAGFPRFQLLPEQKLSPPWLKSDACRAEVKRWLEVVNREGCCILDSNDPKESGDAARKFAIQQGINLQQMRVIISNALGQLIKQLLDFGLQATITCTGGDTLLALMRSVEVTELAPVCELSPGVVLTRFTYQSKTYDIISKSGGFGEPDLLCKLFKLVSGETAKKEGVLCSQNIT